MSRTGILYTIRGILAAAFIALVFTSPAFAGTYVLHPAGFGPHSYAAWAIGAGLPDNTGSANQALYFQKMTTTATNAAGVAVFKGFAGLSTSDLTGLKFWVRDDGWCGAGAPRFNVLVQITPTTKQYFFAGCQAGSGMAPTGASAVAPNGHTYAQRAVVCYYLSGVNACVTLPPGTIVSIAIIFDEGTDTIGNPGFTYLDNIEVDTSAGNHVWTSAADNGDPSGSTTTYDTTVIESELGAPLTSLYILGSF